MLEVKGAFLTVPNHEERIDPKKGGPRTPDPSRRLFLKMRRPGARPRSLVNFGPLLTRALAAFPFGPILAA
jgi:hypothetical protein